MPRQRRTATPKAPRIAPTAMKTVPSGRVELFMNGAFSVGGTAGGGYVGMPVCAVLDKVGSPVSLPVLVGLAFPPPVMVGMAEVGVVVLFPVLVSVMVFPWVVVVVPVEGGSELAGPFGGGCGCELAASCEEAGGSAAMTTADSRERQRSMHRRSDRFSDIREVPMVIGDREGCGIPSQSDRVEGTKWRDGATRFRRAAV